MPKSRGDRDEPKIRGACRRFGRRPSNVDCSDAEAEEKIWDLRHAASRSSRRSGRILMQFVEDGAVPSSIFQTRSGGSEAAGCEGMDGVIFASRRGHIHLTPWWMCRAAGSPRFSECSDVVAPPSLGGTPPAHGDGELRGAAAPADVHKIPIQAFVR